MAQNPSNDEAFIAYLKDFAKQTEDLADKAEEEYFDTLLRLHEQQGKALVMVVDRLKNLDDRVKLLESLSPRPDGIDG